MDELLTLCESWTDLVVEVPLERNAILAFSNHYWLHGRTACTAAGRVTDICLGATAPPRHRA